MANYDHWMRLNIGDYLADTMHLNTLQHGMYVLLIMHYFKRGSLPDERRALAGITKVSSRAWAREAPAILAMFSSENGQLRHKRIDAERAEAERLSSRARASRRAKNGAGLAGARVTTATATNPPPNGRPPSQSRSRKNGADFRNGFGDSASDDLQETIDHAESDHAPPGSATVVPIARRTVGG